MKGLAGVTVGLGVLCKAEEPKYEIGCDPGAKSGSKSVTKEYDLIADLVEEMNEFNKKLPKTKISYSIHCNYTGLAFLNDTGGLDRDDFYGYAMQRGYTHHLWIAHKHWIKRTLTKSSVFMHVLVLLYINADIQLVARYFKKSKDTLTIVTTRCFNVDREEEGKKITGVRQGLKSTCPRCKGDGHWHSTVGFHREIPFVKCPLCDGSGKVRKGKADLFRTYINEEGTKALEI